MTESGSGRGHGCWCGCRGSCPPGQRPRGCRHRVVASEVRGMMRPWTVMMMMMMVMMVMLLLLLMKLMTMTMGMMMVMREPFRAAPG